MQPTILILGLGELGGLMLELLARLPGMRPRLVGADVNEDTGRRKVNSAIQGALLWQGATDIAFEKCDMADVDRLTEIIARVKADLVFNATTVSSWWLRDLLPAPIKAKLHAVGVGSGLWAPGHAAYAYNMMKAVRASGRNPIVVNSAYPDAVNPALARAGLAPDIGIGNGALLEAPFRQLSAQKLKVSADRIRVFLVAHHFHGYNTLVHGDTKGLDFYAKILCDGDDVTAEIGRDWLVGTTPDAARIPAAAGATWIVAAQAVEVVRALLAGSGTVVHVPGPLGLVGGYPVAVSKGGNLTLALPRDITPDKARAINEAGQRAEAIDRFEADGTMVLGDVAKRTLEDVFGLEIDRYPLADCFAIAQDLGRRLKELGERHGVTLKVHTR